MQKALYHTEEWRVPKEGVGRVEEKVEELNCFYDSKELVDERGNNVWLHNSVCIAIADHFQAKEWLFVVINLFVEIIIFIHNHFRSEG